MSAEQQTPDELKSRVDRLTKRVARERAARDQAEQLLEGKSLELYEANKALQRVNNSLEKAVAKRTEELEEALKVAEKANEVKSQFLASMSHELRTPLNGLLGLIDLARAKTVDEEQANFLNHAARSGEALFTLLGDLLDISKIEANQVEIAHEEFKLHELANDLRAMFGGNATSKGLDFQVEVTGLYPGQSLVGDRLRLHQVLWNLISNALKFTDKGTVAVGLHFDTAAESLNAFVKDSGIGIALEMQESVFERFVQLGESYRKAKGTGLGLSISRRLVQLMGGEMKLESQEGQGSEFTFTIPMTLVEMKVKDQVSDGELSDYLNGRDGRAGGEGVDLDQATILVIDDSPANVLLAKASLEKQGWTVHTAKNGQEGLSLIQDQPSDLVLLDLSMPDIDGFEVLRRHRKMAIGPNLHTKVIALTAHVLPSTRSKVIEEGFDGYLGKPIRPNELVDAVREFLTT